MKKLLFILVLAFSQLAWAQNIYAKENAPIIVVEGKQTYLYYTAFFTNNIESINVYKGQKAIDLFGEKAKIGALEIKFKPNTKLLNLDDFYKEYNISTDDQKLPIILNKHFVDEKEYLLLDKSAIVSVQVLDEQPFIEPVLLPKGKAVYVETKEK